MARALSEAPAQAAQRLDRWLFFARFFRSRSLAAAACTAGGVRVDGVPAAKPHTPLRPGQVVTFVQGRHIRVIEVQALASRRGPAPEARLLYRDLAPPTPATALPRTP